MPVPDLQNKVILVVEDDDMSFLYLNQLFMLTRARVVREVTGISAIEQFRNGQGFHLVLMDIQLPDMDGMQVTREIRKTDRNVPIIAQTAGRTHFEREQVLQAGCSDLLSKPFSMDELFDAVIRWIPGN